MDAKEIDGWLDAALPAHDRLTGMVLALLKNLLRDHDEKILEIYGRTKDRDRILEKIIRKKYTNPVNEITDISGLRIIVFFENDLLGICNIIKAAFEIQIANSSDRREILGADKVGYRSIHLICMLGKARSKLTEYQQITDLPFEIQVRTVLQHAWAELAHDRSYKFGGKLPDALERRVNLCSATLEMMDREFVSIVNEIDSYKNKIEQTSADDLLESEVNSISLNKYLFLLKNKLNIDLNLEIDWPGSDEIFEELSKFGVNKIRDLDNIITPNFINSYNKHTTSGATASGFIAMAMQCADFDKYFSTAMTIKVMDEECKDILEEFIENRKIERLVKAGKIRIISNFEMQEQLSQINKNP